MARSINSTADEIFMLQSLPSGGGGANVTMRDNKNGGVDLTVNSDIRTLAKETELNSLDQTVNSLSQAINSFGQNINQIQNDISNLRTSKQDTLNDYEIGGNIKKINGQSILGTGNLQISAEDIEIRDEFSNFIDLTFDYTKGQSTNLLNPNNINSGEWTINGYVPLNTWYNTGYIPIEYNKTYTVQGYNTATQSRFIKELTNKYTICFFDKGKNLLKCINGTTGLKQIAVNEENAKYMIISCATSTATLDEGKETSIVEGTEVINYEPFAQDIYKIKSDSSYIKTINNESPDENGNISISTGGSTVIANPEGIATDDLTKIQINDTIYNIEGSSDVSDVQINGASILDDNKVANIPCATWAQVGVIKTDNYYGLSALNINGTVGITKANNSDIDNRANDYRPITSTNIDYAVKAVMTDGKGAEWSDEEKASARERIGITEGSSIDVQINGTSIVEDGIANIQLKTINNQSIIGEGNLPIEIDPAQIEASVEDYLEKHPVQPYDDTEIREEIENKQDSTDNTLETESKTISGAINEIKQRLDSLLSIEGVEF